MSSPFHMLQTSTSAHSSTCREQIIFRLSSFLRIYFQFRLRLATSDALENDRTVFSTKNAAAVFFSHWNYLLSMCHDWERNERIPNTNHTDTVTVSHHTDIELQFPKFIRKCDFIYASCVRSGNTQRQWQRQPFFFLFPFPP